METQPSCQGPPSPYQNHPVNSQHGRCANPLPQGQMGQPRPHNPRAPGITVSLRELKLSLPWASPRRWEEGRATGRSPEHSH